MDTNLEKLHALIANSGMSEQDKSELIMLFANANDADLASIAQLCSQSPDMITMMSQNYRMKRAAIEADSPAMWDNVVKHEEKFLTDISQKYPSTE